MIYMDNAATSYPKAPGVARAMASYIEKVGANAGRGTYHSAVEADELLFETRQRLCRLFNFPCDDHVLFTAGATAGINMVLRGLLHHGDRVVVTGFEHNAVMRSLYACGARITVLPWNGDGITELKNIEDMIPRETKMVVATGASNVCGALQPLRQLGDICAARKIPFVIDGAQIAGHISVDMEELGCAALIVPAHKGLLGPQGVGAVLIRPDLARKMAPLLYGGTGSHSTLKGMPAQCPDRFEAGTQNLPGIAGWNEALSFIEEQGVEKIRAHEEKMMARFLDGLAKIGGVRLYGPTDATKRVGVFAVDFVGKDNDLCAYQMEELDGIATRSGLHCAPLAHESLGTTDTGLVRFSISFFTEEAEIDAVLSAIKQQAE